MPARRHRLARSRRDLLKLLLAVGAGGSIPARLLAQSERATALALGVTPLPEPLRLVSGAGGNVVVLRGASSVLMVNGGTYANAGPLLAFIAAGTGGKHVETLFNSDWHPEHTGSNAAVAAAGGEVHAHEFTRQYLAIDRYVDWQNRKYTALPANALPAKTFVRPGELMFGGQTVQYGPLGQAHTDGDIYVFFRDANVLVVGDVMTVGSYPIADYTSGGWLGGLVTATRTLLELSNSQTRIVPGNGPVQTRADLQAQHDMLAASREAFVKMMRQGMSADEMLAAGATTAFDGRWGNPQLFVKTSYRSLWLHVRELGGIV